MMSTDAGKRRSRRGVWRAGLLATMLVAAGLAASPGTARAATITVEGFTAGGAAVVRLSGKIVAGDAQKLLGATATVQRAVVVLESKGGMVDEGIRIGSIVRSRAFTTYVPAKAECASMCGVVWLTGQTRLLDAASKVGFHAAYRGEDKEVSGSANALIGAFLQSIGIGYEMIAYVAKASPTTVSWLTVEQAAKMGLTVSIAQPEQVQVKDKRAVPGSLTPVAGVASGTRYSCDLPTSRLIMNVMRKDRDARQAFLKENAALLNRQCHTVADRASLVIETFHTEVPLACVRRPAGAACEWMQLVDLTVTPDVPPPAVQAVPLPPAAPSVVPTPATDTRKAFASRVAAMAERDLCRAYLAGNLDKPDEPYDVVIGEIRKRKLLADRCGGVVACADPVLLAKAKALNALACQESLDFLSIADLCAAALDPAGTGWRDDPAFFWIRAQARQRILTPADCRKLVGGGPGDTATAKGTPSLDAALREALPGLSEGLKERIARSYAGMGSHRALARSTRGTWRSGNIGRADDAQITALEACQFSFGQPCWLVAVDDTVKPAQALGEENARDMPRLSYEGPFDPAQIPVISQGRRGYRDVTDYILARPSKASAIHPRGILVVVTDAPSAFEAERRALDMCGAAVAATPPADACTLYSSGDEVVFVRRSQQPIATPPD